jgi:acyl carrier protein
MINDKIFEKVRQCVASVFNLEKESVSPDSSYETIPNWDSLGHLRLIMAVEEAFAVRFATEEIPTLLNVRLLCDTVGKYVGVRAGD